MKGGYKIDSSDVKAFLLGVLASITTAIVWDYYKKKKDILEYGERKMIDEVTSSVDGMISEVKSSIDDLKKEVRKSNRNG